MLDQQKTPHTSPYRVSYGVPFVNICEKTDHVITAPHYNCYFLCYNPLSFRKDSKVKYIFMFPDINLAHLPVAAAGLVLFSTGITSSVCWPGLNGRSAEGGKNNSSVRT